MSNYMSYVLHKAINLGKLMIYEMHICKTLILKTGQTTARLGALLFNFNVQKNNMKNLSTSS